MLIIEYDLYFQSMIFGVCTTNFNIENMHSVYTEFTTDCVKGCFFETKFIYNRQIS